MITISEQELMLLIRCALFRDSYLSGGIPPEVLAQLSQENQESVIDWEDAAP